MDPSTPRTLDKVVVSADGDELPLLAPFTLEISPGSGKSIGKRKSHKKKDDEDCSKQSSPKKKSTKKSSKDPEASQRPDRACGKSKSTHHRRTAVEDSPKRLTSKATVEVEISSSRRAPKSRTIRATRSSEQQVPLGASSSNTQPQFPQSAITSRSAVAVEDQTRLKLSLIPPAFCWYNDDRKKQNQPEKPNQSKCAEANVKATKEEKKKKKKEDDTGVVGKEKKKKKEDDESAMQKLLMDEAKRKKREEEERAKEAEAAERDKFLDLVGKPKKKSAKEEASYHEDTSKFGSKLVVGDYEKHFHLDEDEALEIDDSSSEGSCHSNQSIRSLSPVHEAANIDHLLSPETSPATAVKIETAPGHGILKRTSRHRGLDLGAAEASSLERQASESSMQSAPEKRSQVDYYRNPTLLSRLIQFQQFERALERLEEFPQEASVWLLAKRLERRLDPNGRLLDSKEHEEVEVEVVKLEQLPLHMACQQLAVHSQSSILLELLTQLLLVYPQACEFPDHTGAHAIHYMVQKRAPPEVVSLALIAYPPSCNLKNPKGKTLQQLFQYAWNDGLLNLFHDSGFVESLTSLMSSGPSFMSSSNLGFSNPRGLVVDRATRRQQEQIAQLLDYDESFWQAAHQESAAMQLIQSSWKIEKQKLGTVKETRARTPWKMLRDKQGGPRSTDGTERTSDETVDFGESDNDYDTVARGAYSKSNVFAGEDEEECEIAAMSWELLEHRTSLMEQLLLETNDQNIDLQERLDALCQKTIRNDEASSVQRTELARQSYSLRQENEALKKELRQTKLSLAQQKQDKVEAAVLAVPQSEPTRRRASINLGDMILKHARISTNGKDDCARSEGSISFPVSIHADHKRDCHTEHTRGTVAPPSDHSSLRYSPPRTPSPPFNCFEPCNEKLDREVQQEDRGGRYYGVNGRSGESPTLELEKLREENRLLHSKYHAYAEKCRNQEASLFRLEAALDKLLFDRSPAEKNGLLHHSATPGKVTKRSMSP